jgi:hypothetical protein
MRERSGGQGETPSCGVSRTRALDARAEEVDRGPPVGSRSEHGARWPVVPVEVELSPQTHLSKSGHQPG